MKRKKSKLIGLALIMSAILLQVAYAATDKISGTVSTVDYEMKVDSEVGKVSDYVKVELKEDGDGSRLEILVSNLYPGASFELKSEMRNTGKNDILFKAINIKYDGDRYNSLESAALYDYLVSYDDQGEEIPLSQYKDYLNQIFKDKVIKSGDQTPFDLWIGLSKDLTELENTETGFSLLFELDYKQVETGTGTNPNTGGPETPGSTTGPDDMTIPDDTIPAGAVTAEVVDEDIPGGQTDIELVDEGIPGGPTKLPKTGGMGALLVYALGLTLLGSGISLYRKGKKDE